MERNEFIKELEDRYEKYEDLERKIVAIIHSELPKQSIDVLHVSSRVKECDSATQKFEEKCYERPFEEMTDLVGIRIVTYLERDVEIVRKIITSLFALDTRNSVDKRIPSRIDAVGYRSLHLICSLGSERNELAEYKDLCELPFEVQIRTTLEHTWASIEHKQKYKSEQSLPIELQRRLHVLSGTLELVDRELSGIVAASEEYQERISNRDNDLEDDVLSETSLVALINYYASSNNFTIREVERGTSIQVAVSELFKFGARTVAETRLLIEAFPFAELEPWEKQTTNVGFVRSMMIASDYEKFFRDVFENDYSFREEKIPYYQKISSAPNFKEYLIERGGVITPIRKKRHRRH